ncbi:MAG TPA: hypothetical protein VMM81_00555 [Acidimicrobiia bacterium]|nr:hypothetical protein [Acidimicrobiia bacterium]
MSGDLSVDLPGIWRFSWTGAADGGPADSLLVFEPDGTAVRVSEKFGRTRWSWSVHGDEVRMFGHVAEGDQGSFSTWSFDDGIWTISAIGYGETTLERCAVPSY